MKILNIKKEFITICIISYMIEYAKIKEEKGYYNKFYKPNCKYCPINKKCIIKRKLNNKLGFNENETILDRLGLSCVIQILKYFNIKDNYKKYITKLKKNDIINLIKAYRLNFFWGDNCKIIKNEILNCPIYDKCNKTECKKNILKYVL